MAMRLVGRIGTGDILLDRDLRDIDIVTGDAGTFLYATTGQNGGISVYKVYSGGDLARAVDSAHYNVWGMGVGWFDAVSVDGQQQLILGGTGAGKLIRYRIESDGGLTKSGKIDLPGLTTQTHSTLIAAPLQGDITAVYTVETGTGALAGWLSSGNGALSGVADLSGAAVDFTLGGPVALAVAQVGSARFLLAADSAAQGVRSYRIDTDSGALTAVDSLGAGQGLGVALPTALETVTAHGATWVVLAAAGSSSLSLMQVSASGQLTPTDHILDTRATRFAGISALEVVKAGDHVFVLAGGADDGISLFTLLPDGHLVHMQTLVQDSGLGLDNVTGITATRTGEEIQIFVSSGGDGGLSQFSLPLADLGAVIEASTTGAGAGLPLSGTGDADLMLGRAGQTTLLGQAGDDILVSDFSGGILTGGAGSDLFVLRPTDQPLQITDFQPGTDRLDLTQFPMLRSVQQLVSAQTETGIRIGFGTTSIDIHSHDGAPLSLQDLWPDGLTTPDRIAIGAALMETLTRGTRDDDVLERGAGADRIRALAGDDRVRAGAGDDLVFGGDGDDRLAGGAGRDRLIGAAGDDRLIGQGGADTLTGGSGQDWLTGGAGKDTLEGGGGRDTLLGNGGNDRLIGHSGKDRLAGQLGDDRLTGGGGADLFVFAHRHGADTITDFVPDQDRIGLEIGGLTFADLEIRAQGADALITTGSGTILLTGLNPTDLGADDFLFL